MNDYPSSYIARPLPLFVLSGFETSPRQDELAVPLKNGPQITSSNPLCTGPYAKQMLGEFLKFSSDLLPSEPGIASGDSRTIQVIIKPTGRTYELPCRKASPASRSPGSPTIPPNVHSTLSPLSPSSPLYPDGVMHPLWNTKWQEHVPSVFISFFQIGTNSGSDDALKNEIIALKTALNEHYRIRFAVVLIGEASSPQDTNTEDRLTSIRKATKLDSKTSFFYAPAGLSSTEQTGFAQSVLSALRPISQEFYRDLTKHARRKKDRWGGPAASPIPENQMARALSRSGWVSRYEWKMGVFAEFRFEMDAASRHFFAALDALFDSDGVLEKLSNWSPRWNEVRLFADCIAIRQIRCLLANGVPMAASRFWVKYRDTTKYLLDRRGKGTACYGWKAWEARWAKIMAELIQRSTSFAIDLIARKSLEGVASNGKQIYVDADRDQTTDDPFEPWDLLHHAGYWLILSADISVERRTLAYRMPEEDRVPPGQSPANRVARRHETYDTYLCPEPHVEYPCSEVKGFDHCLDIFQTLQEALTEFAQREQIRMVDILRLRIAKEFVRAARHEEALGVLKTLWQRHTWRKSHWPSLVKDVASTMYMNAAKANDTMVQILALWELMSFDLPKDIDYDLMGLANKSESDAISDTPRMLKVKHEEVASFLDVSFAFGAREGHASEVVHAQLVIFSKAESPAAPVTLANVTVLFAGIIQRITIDHLTKGQTADSQSHEESVARSLELRQLSEDTKTPGDVAFVGGSDLVVPVGCHRIFNLDFVVREAGNIKAIAVEALLKTEALEIHYSKDLSTENAVTEWWLGNSGKARKKRALRNPGLILIHPKLPKVAIHFKNIHPHYYTDERIIINVEVTNGESSQVDVTLELRIPGHEGHAFSVQDFNNENTSVGKGQAHLLSYSLGKMQAGSTRKIRISLEAPSIVAKFALEAKAVYELESPLTNTASAEIDVVTLFEPQYSIGPELHPAPWPSFFHWADEERLPTLSAGSEDKSLGASTSITHRWTLRADLMSVATEEVIIKSVELEILNIGDGASCTVFDAPGCGEEATLRPRMQLERVFKLDTQRIQLEDLRTTNVEAALNIEWCRKENGATSTAITSIPTPRLVFPSSEPRVLVSRGSSSAENTVAVDLIMENPSMHFLSFNVSLEPDETFGFSGSKLTTKHLAPMSRHTLRYNILPFDFNTPIQPDFKVVDIHFNKTLHINPTGDIRSTDSGILISAVMQE